jgi:excisionase family DNA binding protein
MTEAPEWLPVPDFADRLGVTASHIRELVRDGSLAAVRRGERQTIQLPADFIVEDDGKPVILPTLRGTLTLLHDAGFDDASALEWLMNVDAELGMAPLAALREGRRSHVRRVAQALL